MIDLFRERMLHHELEGYFESIGLTGLSAKNPH